MEKQVNERVDELNKIKIDLKQNEALIVDQSETIKTILNERNSLNILVEKMTKEKVSCSEANKLIN